MRWSKSRVSNYHIFFSAAASCANTENGKPEIEEEEDEELSRMETEIEASAEEAALSPQEQPEGETSPEVLRAYEEQMDCDDNNSMFIDEDSSSSRPFADDTGSTDSQAIPQQESRRNKRKNFLPRNITYNPQDEDAENLDVTGGLDNGNLSNDTTANSSGVNTTNGRAAEFPLDLSETPVRRSLLPRRFSPFSLPMASLSQRSESPNDLLSAHTSSPEATESSALNPNLPDYAQLTMRRLLGLYGLPVHPEFHAGESFVLGYVTPEKLYCYS